MAIVYPDKILDWISARTERRFGWRHVVLIEITALGLMLGAMKLMMPLFPILEWWHPLLFIGTFGLFRFITNFVIEMLGIG